MPKMKAVHRPKALPENLRLDENKSLTVHIPVLNGGGKVHIHELAAGRYFVHFTQSTLKFECSLGELSALGMAVTYLENK